jgi:propanediol utilization protein
MTDSRAMEISQAAEFLGLTVEDIRRLAEQGELHIYSSLVQPGEYLDRNQLTAYLAKQATDGRQV